MGSQVPPDVVGSLQVFDFHHQKFCPGDFNEKGALYAAVATWPAGIRPVVHWSESQEGRIPHAHSDYITVRPLASELRVMLTVLKASPAEQAAVCIQLPHP